MWIATPYQNKGLGKKAVEFLENKYSDANSWILETPQASTRNLHFYEKLGFKKVGERVFMEGKLVLIDYKKDMTENKST